MARWTWEAPQSWRPLWPWRGGGVIGVIGNEMIGNLNHFAYHLKWSFAQKSRSFWTWLWLWLEISWLWLPSGSCGCILQSSLELFITSILHSSPVSFHNQNKHKITALTGFSELATSTTWWGARGAARSSTKQWIIWRERNNPGSPSFIKRAIPTSIICQSNSKPSQASLQCSHLTSPVPTWHVMFDQLPEFLGGEWHEIPPALPCCAISLCGSLRQISASSVLQSFNNLFFSRSSEA